MVQQWYAMKHGDAACRSKGETLDNLARPFARVSQAQPDTTHFHRHVTTDIERIEHEAHSDTDTELPFDMHELNFIFDKIPKPSVTEMECM